MSPKLCSVCRQPLGLLKSFSAETVCASCKRIAQQKYDRFRSAFAAQIARGPLDPGAWFLLSEAASREGTPLASACEYIRHDAIAYIERLFAIARADRYISDEELAGIEWATKTLMIPHAAIGHVIRDIARIRLLQQIRAGKMTPIQTAATLPAGEIPYYECGAAYVRVLKASVRIEQGALLATSKRLLFKSPRGGWEIPLSKIVQVMQHQEGVYLELSRKADNGLYRVHDPELAATIVYALVQIHARQLVTASPMSRSIPQDIRVAVYNRDGGRCAQCQATDYLEYDHMIPFSKGGATSVNNLQLLCRRCNLAKGDRI